MTKTSDHRGLPRTSGFSLLEVIIAMGILALCFVAIGSADSVAILHGSRYHGLTTASLLMRGVVMDIEAEYQEDGFPTNSLTNRSCEVPKEFDDRFDCEYDLEALEIDPAELQGLVEQGIASFLGGGAGAPGGDEKGDKKGETKKGDEKTGEGESGEEGEAEAGLSPQDLGIDLGMADPNLQGVLQGMDPGIMMFLGGLLSNAEGLDYMAICDFQPAAMLANFQAAGFAFPMIVQQAADVTRKLTVRLTWNYGPKAERKLEVTTFIVGLPEEEIRKMREAENLQEIGEDIQGLLSPDGRVPPPDDRRKDDEK